jgi:hypothetical protein
MFPRGDARGHSCAPGTPRTIYITFGAPLYIATWVIPVASEVERAVVEILREKGGKTTFKEIAVELHKRGYSPRSAHGALYYLAVKGLVKRAGKGLYELSGGVEAR